jgi:hypothetical protein
MGLKNVYTAGFLAFLFGPLGMFYTSFAAVLVFGFIELMVIVNIPFYFVFCHLIGVGCNMYMAKEHNDKIEKLFASRGQQ